MFLVFSVSPSQPLSSRRYHSEHVRSEEAQLIALTHTHPHTLTQTGDSGVNSESVGGTGAWDGSKVAQRGRQTAVDVWRAKGAAEKRVCVCVSMSISAVFIS